MKNKSRFSVSHNEETNLCVAVCTKEIEGYIQQTFNNLCQIEFLGGTRTEEDSYYDGESEPFGECVVFRFYVLPDVIKPLHDCFIAHMRKGISKSINHSDN